MGKPPSEAFYHYYRQFRVQNLIGFYEQAGLSLGEGVAAKPKRNGCGLARQEQSRYKIKSPAKAGLFIHTTGAYFSSIIR